MFKINSQTERVARSKNSDTPRSLLQTVLHWVLFVINVGVLLLTDIAVRLTSGAEVVSLGSRGQYTVGGSVFA